MDASLIIIKIKAYKKENVMKKYLMLIAATLSLGLIASQEPKKALGNQHSGIDKLIEPDMGINNQNRELSIHTLNKILADHYVLLVQTLNYHWNVVGPEFHDYHGLFDGQYKNLFDITDQVAERVRALGGTALGSMDAFIKHANIKEDLGDVPAPKDMIKKLLTQYENVIKTIRDAINETAKDNRDMGTNNFLSDLLTKHEKTSWMLRSLLERR